MVAPPPTPDAIAKRLSDRIAGRGKPRLEIKAVENFQRSLRTSRHIRAEPETSARRLSRGEGNAAQRRRAMRANAYHSHPSVAWGSPLPRGGRGAEHARQV